MWYEIKLSLFLNLLAAEILLQKDSAYESFLVNLIIFNLYCIEEYTIHPNSYQTYLWPMVHWGINYVLCPSDRYMIIHLWGVYWAYTILRSILLWGEVGSTIHMNICIFLYYTVRWPLVLYNTVKWCLPSVCTSEIKTCPVLHCEVGRGLPSCVR